MLLIPGGDEEPRHGWAGLHHCCPLPVQIDLPATMSISRGLPGQYRAVQMHLHWGGLDLESSGSEHTIDGMRYFAEVRLVCLRLQGGSGKWGLHPTGAASHRACRSHAQVRGKQGSLRGWCRGRAEPDGAQKAPRKAMARALCSSAAPHSLHKPAKPKVPLVWYEAQSRNWGGDCPFRLSL